MMKKYINSILLTFALISCAPVSLNAQKDVSEAYPFLKKDYMYEYLNVAKTIVDGNVISETRVETTYDDNNRITSIITTTNGQKTMEMVDFIYGDRTKSNVNNTYMNGEKFSTQKVTNSYVDDYYRNIGVAEIETEMKGKTEKQRNEWVYDEQERVIGMKQYLDGKLQKEEKDYVWTPNSCEYEEISYFPISSTSKVSKQFQDENYVQNVLEVHKTITNGLEGEFKVEVTYDENGNIISTKNFRNGQLIMEFKDYDWSDKKCTYTAVMYMNGAPCSTLEIERLFK